MSRLLRTVAAGTVLGVAGALMVVAPAQASQPLRGHAAARGILIGAAVANNPLSNETTYRNTLNREFNAVTAENAMKWDATEPSPGQFTFAAADQIMANAEANGQTVHGHTLVWHNQTPSWVQNLDAVSLRSALENHISTVVGRYAGRIASWDVVNEVFDDSGNLRNSFWYQKLGAGYIADAFRFARAADPNATLCINDYNVEGINSKSTAMYNLVRDLRAQGVPVDCVGLQTHLAIQFGFPSDLRQNIQRFADLGVDVRISELDVRMQLPADATKLQTQATYYRNVLDACLAVPRCVAVTIWGFTDKYSWVPDTFNGQGAALIYDENYTAKPAYTAVHDALAAGGGGDTTPPSSPGTPTVSNVTATTATLSWAASTDSGSGVAGYAVYRTQASGDTLLAQSSANSVALSGLSPSTTYQVFVRATDNAGNVSAPSATASFATEAGGGNGSCAVAYQAGNWGGASGLPRA